MQHLPEIRRRNHEVTLSTMTIEQIVHSKRKEKLRDSIGHEVFDRIYNADESADSRMPQATPFLKDASQNKRRHVRRNLIIKQHNSSQEDLLNQKFNSPQNPVRRVRDYIRMSLRREGIKQLKLLGLNEPRKS